LDIRHDKHGGGYIEYPVHVYISSQRV